MVEKTRVSVRRRLLFLPRLEMLESRIQPATFVVATAADNGDNASPTPGSLRAAIIAANSNPGSDTIAFDIPGAGVQTLNIPRTLPAITGPVVIDGFTQPGSSPNSNPIDQPSNAVIRIELVGSTEFLINGLLLLTDGSTVRGLAMNNFRTAVHITGSNNRIAGNYLGTNAAGTTAPGNESGVYIVQNSTRPVDNIIGGVNAEDRNVIAGGASFNSTGVFAYSASGVQVLGNFIGIDAAGTTALGMLDAVRFEHTSDSIIGGVNPQARNVMVSSGFGVLLFSSSDVLVQGNYIGADRTGTTGLGTRSPSSNAVAVGGNASNNLIGGRAAGAGNVIGTYGIGVHIASGTSQHTVQGNYIGTDRTGAANFGNSFAGVVLANPVTFENLIGGIDAGAGNIIAFNGAGVIVGSGAQGAILGNSIYGNAPTANQPSGLGIDLLPPSGVTGPTPNDPGDSDESGGNRLQNFPVLTSASVQANSTLITGILNSTPSTPLDLNRWRIEFFASAAADPSGHGEGQTYLGFTEVTTDEAGNASFQASVNAAPAGQRVITATATFLEPADSPEGWIPRDTSEFSAAITAGDNNQPPTAEPIDVETSEDTPVVITLRASDADGDMLTFRIVRMPAHGTLSDFGTPEGRMEGETWVVTVPVTYAPNANYNGSDSFVFVVNDGVADSEPATVSLTVRPVNDPPIASATPSQLTVSQDAGPTPIVLTGSDIETAAANLRFTVTAAPAHGVLRRGTAQLRTGDSFVGSPANLAYQPHVGYTGADEFRFRVIDRGDPDGSPTGSPPRQSNEAIVSIEVRAPAVMISDAAITEGHAGTRNAVFDISLSHPSTRPIEVAVATAQGTATAGKDYYSLARIVRFAVGGPTTQRIEVRVIGDRSVESDETFFVNILNAKGAIIADGQGVGVIVNDDVQPAVSISDATILQGSGGVVDAVFTIRLNQPTQLPVRLVARTFDGTALAGRDYAAVSTVVTFLPGAALTRQIRVRIFGVRSGGLRNFFMRIGEVSNALLADGEGEAVIGQPN